MAAVQPQSTLEANEKGAAYTTDVDSSTQVSSAHHDFEDLPDPDVGKSDAERAALVSLMFTIPLSLHTDFA